LMPLLSRPRHPFCIALLDSYGVAIDSMLLEVMTVSNLRTAAAVICTQSAQDVVVRTAPKHSKLSCMHSNSIMSDRELVRLVREVAKIT
jgi:hypothetical protein